MKKNKIQGFSIIELVIVIAVIAVLSAVLIPTFGSVIENSRNSSRDSKAKNAYSDFVTRYPTKTNKNIIIEIKDGGKTYYYSVTDGQIDLEKEDEHQPVSYTDKLTVDGYIVYFDVGKLIWQQKWNDMVILKSKDTKTVSLSKVRYSSSSSQTFLTMSFDKEDEINDILVTLEDLSFTKTENYEIDELNHNPKGAEYQLTLIHDVIQKDFSSPVIGDTVSHYNYSLTLYIDNVEDNWYALIVVYNGVGYDVYKSNAKDELAEFGEMYEAFSSSPKM